MEIPNRLRERRISGKQADMAPRVQIGDGIMRIRNRSTERGYSLAEALVVVGIVGIISVVTVPNFISLYRSGKIKSSVRSLATDLRGARQTAVTKHRRVMVSLGTSATEKYSYWTFEEINGTWTPSTGQKHDLEPNVDAKSVYFGTNEFTDDVTTDGAGRKDIIFRSDGSIDIPGTRRFQVKSDDDIPKKLYVFELTTAGTVKAN